MHEEETEQWTGLADHLNSELNTSKFEVEKLRKRLDSLLVDKLHSKRNHESTLRDIASSYNQNRTQLFTDMDDMELAMHSLKHEIEKKKIKD